MGDLTTRNMTVFAEQIYLLRLKEILFQDTVQILLQDWSKLERYVEAFDQKFLAPPHHLQLWWEKGEVGRV